MVKYVSVPLQVLQEDIEIIEKAGDVFSKVLYALFSLHFLIKFLLRLSLSDLWSIINNLQIIRNLSFFAIKIPGNWILFSDFMEEIVSL